MIKKLISILCVLSAAVSLIPAAAAEEAGVKDTVYKQLLMFNFDSVEDGKLSSYSENGVSVYIDNKETAYVSGETAPAGKRENSSLSEGDTDKVMAFNLGNKSQNPNIRFSFSESSFKGKVKLSYNYYVPQCTNASYGLFNADIRNKSDNQSYNVIMSLRGNKNFQYCPTVNSSANNGTFALGTWYTAELYIDADSYTYDLYVNGALKGEGCKLKDGVSFDEFRFSTNNTSQNLSNTYVYVDDLYMGVETERPTPVFAGTIHESETENTEISNVPDDMTGIKVQFPFDMDSASFEGNVTLKKGNGTDVPFTGVYNSEDRTFTAVLGEKAVPCTEYTLTFGEKIKTSSEQSDKKYADVYLTTEEVISVMTQKVDFAVLSSCFTSDADGNTVISSVPSDAEKIYGRVEFVSSDLLESAREITAFVLCYRNGMMDKVFAGSVTAEPSEGINRRHMSVEADLSEITIDSDTRFEIIVWDNYKDMLPLFGNTQISGQ